MLIRPTSPGELKYSSVVDAIHRGILQRGRLLRLDTPLGADVLIPLRAQGWACSTGIRSCKVAFV